MHGGHFLASEKGIRHATEASALRHRAIESDADNAEAGPGELAKPGKTLRQTRDRLRPLDRSVVQSKLDGVGCRSCAERARRPDKGARCRARGGTRLRRRARETNAEDGGFRADGRSELQLLSQTRFAFAARRP